MTPKPASDDQEGRYRLTWWTLCLALVAGGIMRFIWIEDMEWKHDERWTYVMSQEVGRTRPWPSVGMPTSLRFPNPGPSVWIFVPIGRVADRPTTMARVVACLNMIGLIGFVAAVRAYLPPREAEPWLWGLALQAVNPFAIRMSRKIWPPSILTPLLLLLWIAHQQRRSRWGAFSWGLVGTLIGQVHLSGWYVAAGLVLGTAIGEYRGLLPRSRYWHFWLLGSVLGLIGAISWVRTLSHLPFSAPDESFIDLAIHRIAACGYSLPAAASGAFPYSFLGLGQETTSFLIGPVVLGVPIHIAELAGLYMGLVVAARVLVWLIRTVVGTGLRWTLRRAMHDSDPPSDGEATASAEPAPAVGSVASTRFYIWSTLAIPIVFYLLTIEVYFYHYFFAFCPFLFVGVATFLLPWRRALMGMVVAQTLMSMLYLDFIHARGGVRRGEYGLTYTRQVNR